MLVCVIRCFRPFLTSYSTQELKKKFERSSDDADNSLAKYMAKRPRDQTLAEASRDLYENRIKFQADYMEYVMKLNEVEAKKKFDFVENVRPLYREEGPF